MQDELAARQRAITLRLTGRPTKAICAAVGRSEVWFRKWWGRYLECGPEGLYAHRHLRRLQTVALPDLRHARGTELVGVPVSHRRASVKCTATLVRLPALR
jgi:hypothetical protein